MKCLACSRWIAVAVLASLGSACSDENNGAEEIGRGLKTTGREVAQTTKEVSIKVGDEVAEAASALQNFGENLAANVGDTAEDVGRSIEAKMPDVENLVTKAKEKLEAGGAEAKEQAAQLDDKLLTLKNKLASLTKAGANATREAKDDVVAAFKDLVESVQSGLSKLR